MLLNDNMSSWLKKFLATRGLNQANGKPLYTYRMTDNEFEQLKRLLHNHQYQISSSSTISSALFCLYSAEWYRREYQEGWSWNGIMQSLGIQLDSTARTSVIQVGFKYWKRSIVRYNQQERHSYLGSVYREGGLPYSLLISEDSKFQELFRKILEFSTQNPQILLEPLLLIPYLTYFPEALKGETTLSLITNMATQIASLVEKYSLSEYEYPAKHLDTIYPDWKMDFPIPLKNDTADKFLANLIDSSATVRKKYIKNNESYILKQFLVDVERLQIQVEISFTKQISINSQSRLNESRCQLSLYEGTNRLAHIGSAYVVSEKTNTEYVVMLRQSHIQTHRKEIKLPLFIVLEQQGAIVYKEIIPESEINIEEMPLILQSDYPHKIIGSGSIQKKSDILYVITKQNINFQLQDKYSELVENGIFNGYVHYLLSGKINIIYNNEKFYISTQNEKLKKKLKLVGKVLPYFTPNGRPIYLGIPKISQSDDEFRLSIEQEDNGNLTYGEQSARILDKEGNLIFKQKVAILPEDFKIILNKSNNAKEGSITFNSNRNFIIYKPYTPELESKVSPISDTYSKQLLIKNTGIFKSKFTIGLAFNLLSKVEITLPFPSTGVQILSNTGQEISLFQSLSTQELLGSQILFYPDINSDTIYSIDFENSQKNNYNFKYLVQDTPLEMSLNEFKPEIYSLFSISKNLDEQVKVTISQNGRIIRQINITLYKTEINIIGNYISVGEYHNDIHLEYISLTDLECIKLEKNESGDFLLPNNRFPAGLVIPSADSSLQSRARLIPSTMQSEIKGELQQAIALPPESYSESIQLVLNKMANDLNHSGWDYLNKLYQNFSYLPLSTFLIWKELVRNSEALTTFIVRSSDIEKVMEHFQNEFNVIWVLVPKYLWKNKLELLNQIVPKELISPIINHKTEQIYHFVSSLKNTDNKFTEEMARYILPTWHQDLKNKNLDRYWIHEFGYELYNWANEKRITLPFTIEHGYQQAVILFPFFAAEVTCGISSIDSLRPLEDKDFYTFKMLMEFDSEWFNSVYLYAIQLFENKDK
ncbi:STY4851/ECs_5259 family protein [Mannheimia sp. AT1]|uniref:STY4851/ECs_5259 family protein n=1 Tax=Mannheimia cairinae TaxID=3025936 RepID=A0ABT5MSE9_9PAST|nr:STY4851/ECs_5259 family protein [Mannheimia cairinae]MDD0823807.1 STY4851/ECs_5259 family protein [Mannheimia cairinae]MDD0825123.1 STY4851/ECs_5259 family protein [Mannheimia cairinae]